MIRFAGAALAVGLVLGLWSSAEAAVIDVSGTIRSAFLRSGLTGTIPAILSSNAFSARLNVENGSLQSVSFSLPDISFSFRDCGQSGSGCGNEINSLISIVDYDLNPGFSSTYKDLGSITNFSISTASHGSALGYFANNKSFGQFDANLRIYSIGRADNGGWLSATFDIQPVPLPAALPMFGAALLGLGAFAWQQRVRGAR